MYHSSKAHCFNVLKTFLTRDSDTVHCPSNSIITLAPPHAEILWKHHHRLTHNRNRQLPYDRFAHHHHHLQYPGMYVSNNNNNSNSKIKKGIRKNSVALAVAEEKNQQKTRAKSGKAKHKKIE